ncbi:FG-GAP-like repeat-containing protein [Cellulomonas fimi]|uniref:FG-GAP-like repeat-containing protein n=1 Tax=Cellulomonas fimi TaxID=1708 RepID=UPI0023583926|nr:FG-GAP-like repeat-containing protein [Cellulomonas fimi]
MSGREGRRPLGRTGRVWAVRAGVVALVLGGVGVPSAYAIAGATPTGAVAAATVKLDVTVADHEARACSGALVNRRWVVTAKSCFQPAPGAPVVTGTPAWTTKATVGRVDLTGTAGRVVAVDWLEPHPDRDVVLARLAEPVDGVATVGLASTAPAVGQELTVAGYGRTATSLVPDTAHAATYTVTAVAAGTIDIQATGAGSTICKGDAGGPALRATATGVELVAIHHTAYQGGCLGSATTRQGATETRVDVLRDWIGRTINASGIDLDGNGRADVFWASPNDGRWRVSADGTAPWSVINGAGVLPASWYRFGDLNGDGKDDVFLAHPDGRWLVSYSGTSGWVQTGKDPNAAGNVKLGDLNGDGKDDIFWAWAADGNWRVTYDGGATNWSIINNGGAIGTERFQLGDVNGDGKDDVFLPNSDGRFLVSYSGTSAWTSLGSDTNPQGNVKLGDMNGDGKDDIFWAWPVDGNWRVLYQGESNWKIINNGGALGTERFQLADLDGDGKDDVFLANSDGRWLVSYGGTTGWHTLNGDGESAGQVVVR